MKQTVPLKNVQRSRHSSSLTPAVKRAFENARKCYQEIRGTQASALDKAREAGEWLDKARTVIKKEGGSFRTILGSQMKEFGKGSVANAYNYITIYEKWNKLEPERKKNPDLSIDGALRFLKTGSIQKPGRRVEPDKLIAEIVEDALEGWGEKEKEWLSEKYAEVISHLDYGAELRRAFEKIRAKVRAAMESEQP
jgi:hypothetical protein